MPPIEAPPSYLEGASRRDPSVSRPFSRLSISNERPGTLSSARRKRGRGNEDESGPGFTVDEAASRAAKRRRTQLDAASETHEVVDLTLDEPEQPEPFVPKRRRTQSKKSRRSAKSPEEHRQRLFRDHPPQSFLLKLERARLQRMFVIDRSSVGTDEEPREEVTIIGTTGNLYIVTIGKEPNCSCPDSRKGNQCKHIVYVLHNVLKAPEHLQYQLAFLSSELREIFARAPANIKYMGAAEGNRRKRIDGACPICFLEFQRSTEDIVWCRTSCGNNVHKDCFQQWEERSRALGEEVKCIYCRTLWLREPVYMNGLLEFGRVNDEGYINVGEQLDLPEERGRTTIPLYRTRRTSLLHSCK